MKIYEGNYFYEQVHSNDNCLIQAPVWDGWQFMGFFPVRGNWKRPDDFVDVLI